VGGRVDRFRRPGDVTFINMQKKKEKLRNVIEMPASSASLKAMLTFQGRRPMARVPAKRGNDRGDVATVRHSENLTVQDVDDGGVRHSLQLVQAKQLHVAHWQFLEKIET